MKMEPFAIADCNQYNVIIPDRLYFVSCTADVALRLRAEKGILAFSIDTELVYENFHADFGPLNLSMLYRYCVRLERRLWSATKLNRKIVHFCGTDERKRVNAAFLIGAFQVIVLHRTSQEALSYLETPKGYLAFRDASIGPNVYPISLKPCLDAIEKAISFKWFDFNIFNCDEYEYYERVENGDLNWIIPKKILAFCGPHSINRVENGCHLHSPETYFAYFRRQKVTDIIRLNKKMYDANKFIQNGFKHHDLFFLDGSTPTFEIMFSFIEICENAKGAVAVHCKAGLGRTGTLIGCYIMKHFHMTAQETIAWLRICRPGSVIGVQQFYLHQKEELLRNLPKTAPKAKKTTKPPTITATRSTTKIFAIKKKKDIEEDIMKCVAEIKLDSRISTEPETQGDQLNRIKALRKPKFKAEKT